MSWLVILQLYFPCKDFAFPFVLTTVFVALSSNCVSIRIIRFDLLNTAMAFLRFVAPNHKINNHFPLCFSQVYIFFWGGVEE